MQLSKIGNFSHCNKKAPYEKHKAVFLLQNYFINFGIMYESSASKLAPVKVFRKRILKASLLTFLLFTISLFIGIMGYHYLGNLQWVDSFINAAMILGGMGPVSPLDNDAAKIFAGCYALFSGVTFLIGMGVVLAPLLHRFLHKFHLDLDEEDDN
jgi:hypothetical protein